MAWSGIEIYETTLLRLYYGLCTILGLQYYLVYDANLMVHVVLKGRVHVAT